ncbi:hypothetical protein OIO90_003641 [Microbotryomycetes sp. JL221]|nr:hypothetical protein OIO90_003641 [Microbotryomycetes sp. JL221]
MPLGLSSNYGSGITKPLNIDTSHHDSNSSRAQSPGAASNLDAEEDHEKFWSELDEAGRALKQRGVGLVNYNLEDLPAADIAAFSVHTTQLWTSGFLITCTIIMILAHLRLNKVLPYVTITLGVIVTRRVVENSTKDFAWDVERKRGTNTKSAYESIEWLNTAVGTVWSIIDPELFTPAIDLQVRSVRITSVEHGTNSIRLLGLRHLPTDMDITTPLEQVEQKRSSKKDPQMAIPEPEQEQEGGKFINLECTFAYRRLPKPKSKSTNAHFVVHLGLGVRKLVKVEVPVLVELSGLHGILRLRLEMVPEPPFVRREFKHLIDSWRRKSLNIKTNTDSFQSNTFVTTIHEYANITMTTDIKFCFPRVPKLEIIAKPLGTLDVMTLPGVSSYVLASIDTVLNYFTAPKSYTIDATRFVLGSDVALRTRSVGILCIVIHSARNLLAADLDGRSDGYCEISYAHVGKVLYRTKVYPSSLHPAWNEIAFCLVGSEELDEDDSVRITVWDHDRFSSNDLLGSVIVPLKQLHDQLGSWLDQTTSISSSRPNQSKAGTLSYSAAFFPLARTIPPNQATTTTSTTTDQQDLLMKRPSKKPRVMYGSRSQTAEGSKSNEYAQRVRDMLDSRSPANVNQPTGVVSFQIHQMAEVESKRDLSSRFKTTTKTKFKSSTTTNSDDIPSSYVNVFLNDDKVFQTRMKPLTATPYFNASSETIVRDWRTARMDFAVMDYHDRNHDTLIGFVSIHLGDVLSRQSQITKWAPIVGGSGSGRLRFSILFKPLDIRLPPPLLEWNIGCLEIISAKAYGLTQDVTARLNIKAEGRVSVYTNSDLAMPDKPGSNTLELNWIPDKPLKIPVLSRTSPIVFHIESVRTIQRNEVIGFGALWFGTIQGNHQQTIDIPLIDHEFTVPQSPPLPQLASKVKRNKKDKQRDKNKEYDVVQDLNMNQNRPLSPQRLNSKKSNTSSNYDQTNNNGEIEHNNNKEGQEEGEEINLQTQQSLQSTPSTKPIGYLNLTIRWKSGLKSCHRQITTNENSSTRSSYQLMVYRNQFKKSEIKRKRKENEMFTSNVDQQQSFKSDNNDDWIEDGNQDGTVNSNEGDEEGEEYETDEETTSEEDSLWQEQGVQEPTVSSQVKQQVNKMKPKAGTMKWMAHGVKVASRKVARGVSTKDKKAKPIPVETEGMSSF